MKYEAYPLLANSIIALTKKFNGFVYFGSFVLIAGVILMLTISSGSVEYSKIVLCILIFIATVAFLQHQQIVPNATTVNNTAIEVNITEGVIKIQTSSFKVTPWSNKLQKALTFSISESKIIKTAYPIKQVFDLNNRVFKLFDKEKEVYIITDFFDDELSKELASLNLPQQGAVVKDDILLINQIDQQQKNKNAK